MKMYTELDEALRDKDPLDLDVADFVVLATAN